MNTGFVPDGGAPSTLERRGARSSADDDLDRPTVLLDDVDAL